MLLDCGASCYPFFSPLALLDPLLVNLLPYKTQDKTKSSMKGSSYFSSGRSARSVGTWV